MEKALIPINDIVITGWNFYKNSYRKFIKPLAIMAASYVVYIIYFQYLFAQMDFWLALSIGILILLGFAFINLWVYIIIIKMIDACLKNKQFDDNSIFENSLKNIVPVLWISILILLIVIGGFFLLIIPAIFWSIWYSFAVYASILENNNPKGMKALAFSKKLTKKRAWDTFGRLVFPSLFVELLAYLGVIILFAILSLLGVNIETSFLITYIIFLLLMFALMPLLYAFQIILYNSLKATRQELPTESMQPTPLTPPTQS